MSANAPTAAPPLGSAGAAPQITTAAPKPAVTPLESLVAFFVCVALAVLVTILLPKVAGRAGASGGKWLTQAAQSSGKWLERTRNKASSL